jgi:hypothetical protein
VHSFETELLTQDESLTGLAAINRALLARVEAMESARWVVLDIDKDPHPFYEELRQQGPVPYDRATGDYWVLHHAHAMLVLADCRLAKRPYWCSRKSCG